MSQGLVKDIIVNELIYNLCELWNWFWIIHH